MKKVGIVSYGISPYYGAEDRAMWGDEATFKVAKQALDKVGLSASDIDTVILSSMDGIDGITISSALMGPAAGAFGKESTRIENGGIHCAISAIAGILSGSADIVVVASSDTISTNLDYVSNTTQDSVFRAPLGFNQAQSYGLLATEYLKSMNVTEGDFAAVAEKNYKNATNNELAHKRTAHSAADIQSSEMVSWPLTDKQIAGHSFGACALIFASEETAKKLTDSPIWVTGVGVGANAYFGSWEELSENAALEKAAKDAYKKAGISNPKNELDYVEISDPFSAFELKAYENLGLCEKGEAAQLLRDGTTSADGSLPVNLSGGALATYGLNSAGVFRIVQALRILNNEMESVDTGNAKRALVHDSDACIGAVGGDSHAVMILEKGA
ncbi:thiolase family protein [Spongiibacter marinus]|uniref:thiolase family protein n=1 Tax=Spongiibacter marinus TaxID=354246 RepID=UPI0035BE3B35